MSAPPTKARSYRFSVFEVQSATQEVRKRGLRMKIAGQPFHILTLLLEKQGEVLTREELRRAIWPEEAWGDHDQRLNKAMTKVREVLGDSADTPRFIETIPKIGYRFLVPVEIHEAVETPQAVEASSVAASDPPQERERLADGSRPEAKGSRWNGYWPVGAVLAAGMVGALAYIYWPRADRVPAHSLISRPLTTFVGAEHSPNYSPDGKQIVFAWTGESGTQEDLFLTDPVSGGARRLTRHPEPDSAPAFAPDGKTIAFRRNNSIWVLDAATASERKVADIESSTAPGPLAWTPDGKWLVSASRAETGNLALFAMEVATGQRHQLTQPPAGFAGDRSPVFSPNGRLLAFTRHTTPEWREIFVADFDPAAIRCRGEVRRVTQQKLRIDQVAFTPGGKELLFAGATPSGGASYISRVDLASGEVRELAGVRVEGNNFALSPDGGSIVVSRRSSEATSLRKLNLSQAKAGTLVESEPLLRSTAPDYSPDVSSDGNFVVMSSSRSGTPQLWVFPLDQPAPKQLTFLGNSGASVPRWSPDGNRVCFESRPDGQADIFTIETATGKIQRVTESPIQESRCSWSRDGRFLYYGSILNGRMELHRMPYSGGKGAAERVTAKGGTFAVESPDGRWLYYSTPEPKVEIRRRRMGDNENLGEQVEEIVATEVLGRSALAVGRRGLYYLSVADPAGFTKIFLAPIQDGEGRLGKPAQIGQTSLPVHNAISLSPDEKWLVYTELQRPESDLKLFTNLR
jgi:Tol biopolymer transport system component/DNA-binding winged helix-turn-helix (wHTH) protein